MHVLFIDIWKIGSASISNPTVASIYTSWDWNLAETVLFIDIWSTGSGYNSNLSVFILAGIGILPKYTFYVLISGRQYQVIIPWPIPQYLFWVGLESCRNSCFIY
jgi:hypothetical protein